MKKFILPLLATLLVPFSEVVSATSFEVLYAASENNIETTTPLDDLKGDEDFKYAYENGEYHVGDNVGYRVIDLAEYKYGTSGYALYIYLWNCEQDSRFVYDSPRNRLEIQNQKNNEYIHLNVEFISKSSTLFYKYKVEFDESTVSFVSDAANDVRVYNVIGFEAYETGDLNARDYRVGKNFKYTGYYYDETLKCESSDIETLSLEVNAGLYRTESSSESQTARNDLYYVWFGIDNNLFTKYGNLYAIHCDYYKFDLSYKIGAILTSYMETWNNYSQPIQNSTDWKYFMTGDGEYISKPYATMLEISDLNTKFTSNYLNSIFSMNDVCSLCGVNFNDIALKESAGFYKNVNISADVNYDLLSYGSTHNGWQNFWAKLKGVNTSEVSLEGIPAIQRFQDNSSINDCSCIDSYDKSQMTSYKSSHASKDVVCLRFATGIYDSTEIFYDSGMYIQGTGPVGHRYETGFIAKRGLYAFMDFDIIDVTFATTMGEKTVLPVVADPVNVWSSLENTSLSVTGPDWTTILGLILQIFAIFVALLFGIWLLTKTLHFESTGVSRISNKKRKRSKRYRHK